MAGVVLQGCRVSGNPLQRPSYDELAAIVVELRDQVRCCGQRTRSVGVDWIWIPPYPGFLIFIDFCFRR